MNKMDENEIDGANDLADCTEIGDYEIDVTAATDYDSAGCAGCFLLPILLLLIVFTGSILAF
jgi:hypothetical protein